MPPDVHTYFHETIIPTIMDKHPDVASEMSLMVLGSAGLGIADEASDLEAAVYLEDPLWKKQGGQLQLTLNECLYRTCPYKMEGSVISVSPLSWLLDGHAKEFLERQEDLPWEKVSFEDLFTMQENLIVWDAHNLLHDLREVTAPQRLPEWLWKKLLILKLKKLIYDDLGELESVVKRGRSAEAHILLGLVLEDLFHTGFMINREYYPWRTHLRWAFERLPAVASDVLPHVDIALSAPDWHAKVVAIKEATSLYKQYLSQREIIPEIDILSSDLGEEFVWAERLKAWGNPNWRDWIVRCKERAVKSGYPAREFWVWSLWD